MAGKFRLHLEIVDEDTGEKREVKDIPVLKNQDPEYRRQFLSGMIDKLFGHLMSQSEQNS